MTTKALPASLQKLVAKYPDRFDEGWTEQDSFERNGSWTHWVYLKRGWHNAVIDPWPGVHIIHEPTVKEVRRQFLGAKPCTCESCTDDSQW